MLFPHNIRNLQFECQLWSSLPAHYIMKNNTFHIEIIVYTLGVGFRNEHKSARFAHFDPTMLPE